MEVVKPLTEKPVRKFEKPEVVLQPGYDYYAELKVPYGTILIDLFEDQTPNTVNSFVFLALHRFYDGLIWHRVVPGFVVQTGDPTGTGAGDAGYYLPLEIAPGLAYDEAGMVGMARTQDPNTNSSQFFITLAPAPHLTGKYTLFGRVVAGREHLFSIKQGDPLIEVRILRKKRP